MFSDDKPNHPHQIGAIDPKCKVLDILEGIKIAFLSPVFQLKYLFMF